jgi:hypothetical protein
MRLLVLPLLAAIVAAAPARSQEPQATESAQQVAARAATDSAGAAARRALAGGIERRTLRADRAAQPPTIDGRLDETDWARAPAAGDFIQVEPHSGSPASERTDVRVLYDAAAVYVGVRLFDSRPDSIVGRLGRRDEAVYSDWFTVQIDSYHDGRTAFSFGTNPRGVKRDALMFDDTRSDGGWDAVWDVATRVDSLGWTAEFRIPLSQLRFSPPATAGAEVTWGINFQRQLARRDERSNWSPILRGAGRMVSLFGELRGLRDLRASQPLEVVPYSLVRLTREPGDTRDPFYEKNDLLANYGADLKYRPTSNLTLTATFNPDFGQVEADPAVVNVTAYEVFFPERRPFFTEGSDLFGFGAGGAQLFYSRRIGRSPQRTVTARRGYVDAPAVSTVLAAAKLTGQTRGGWSIGALDAVTGAVSADVIDSAGRHRREPIEPLTNYAVLRAGRNFPGGRSGASAFLTATNRRLEDPRLAFLRSAAYSGGAHLRHRLGGGEYEISGSALGSYVTGSARAIARTQAAAGHYFQRPDAPHLRYDTTRTSLAGAAGSVAFARIGGTHWTWGANGSAVAPGVEVNDLGSQRLADRVSQGAYLSYSQSTPGRVLRYWDVSVSQWAGWTFGRERTSSGIGGSFGTQLLNYWGASGGLSHGFQSLATDALWGGPALMGTSRTDVWLSMYGDGRRTLSFQAYANASRDGGTDGRSLGVGAGVQLRPASGVDISLGPYLSRSTDAAQYLGVHVQDEASRYLFGRLDQTNASLTARVNVTFTPTLSLQVHAQPFIGAGEYSAIAEARALRARRFADRFHTFRGAEVRYDSASHGYFVDLAGQGVRSTYVYDPSFNSKSLNSNTVLRWEYQPGSSVFVVWTQGRSDYVTDGSFEIGRDARRLFGRSGPLPVRNVVAVKASYALRR